MSYKHLRFIIVCLLLNTSVNASSDECKSGFSVEVSPILLAKPIEELGLSASVVRILAEKQIVYVGNLITHFPEEILSFFGLKEKGLKEIEQKLAEQELQLGMTINWPAELEQAEELFQKSDPQIPIGLTPHLAHPIERLNLFPYESRARMTPELRENLKKAGVIYLGDLIAKTPEEILKILALKKSALPSINRKLFQWGLQLGMNIKWPKDRQQVEMLVYSLNPRQIFFPLFLQSIRRLDFSSHQHHERITRALKQENISYLGELITKTADELLNIPGIGEASVKKIKRALAKKSLRLGMNIDWPKDRQQVEAMVIQWNPDDLEQPTLHDRLNTLSFPNSLINSLGKANIIYIGDLVGKTSEKLLKVKGIGQAELIEIEKKLSERGFHLNMSIIWPSNRNQLNKMAERRQKSFFPFQIPDRSLITSIDIYKDLPEKTKKFLRDNNILYLGDVVIKTPEELLSLKGFEEIHLSEIKTFLEGWNLELGMNILWPTEREQVEKLVRKARDPKHWPPVFLLSREN